MPDHPIKADQSTGQTNPVAPGEYWFKLRVELCPQRRFDTEKTELLFSLDEEGKEVKVTSAPPGPIGGASTINFDVHGFNSFEDAHKAGLRLRRAVLLAACISGIGVDVGPDQAAPEKEREEKRAWGYRVKNAMQGLTVHKGQMKRKIMWSDVQCISMPDPVGFLGVIQSKFSENPVFTDLQLLALELYGLSQFETSGRARFLVLTSVVEVLSKRELRPQESLDILDQMAIAVESSSLESDQKKSLKDGIDSLRRESISKACKRLVRNYLGKKAADEFRNIYDLRSALLHTGDCKDADIDLAGIPLTSMIEAIFKKMILPSDGSNQPNKKSNSS